MGETIVQSIEKRGRLYLLAFISILVIGDLLLKGLLLAAGNLRLSQAGGTAVTLLACWFLWRGSSFAYWFLVICTALAVAFSFLAAAKIAFAVAAAIGIFMALLLFLLVAPATRRFLASRRAASA